MILWKLELKKLVSQEFKKDESKLPEVGINPQSEVEDVFTSTRAQPHQVPVTPDSTLSGKPTDESTQAFKPADYEQTSKNDQSSSSSNSSSSSKTFSSPTTPVVSQDILQTMQVQFAEMAQNFFSTFQKQILSQPMATATTTSSTPSVNTQPTTQITSTKGSIAPKSKHPKPSFFPFSPQLPGSLSESMDSVTITPKPPKPQPTPPVIAPTPYMVFPRRGNPKVHLNANYVPGLTPHQPNSNLSPIYESPNSNANS